MSARSILDFDDRSVSERVSDNLETDSDRYNY